ncbi:MAG: FAD-dependent oxidoreductase [Candidatus Dormibacteraceae bacterium]
MKDPLTLQSDVVVVGGGFGGLTAAIRAQELGLRPTVLERSTVPFGWSNSRMSGARFHMAGGPPWANPVKVADRLIEDGDGQLNEPLVRAWTAACERAYRWTRQQGIRYVMLRGTPVMAPIRPNRRGEVWRGRGADVAIRRLHGRFLARGGQYLAGIEGARLSVEGCSVVGGTARDFDGDRGVKFSCRAVVLADGGFQANLEMLRRHASIRRPERLIQRGAGTGCGASLQMAEEAGATVVNGDALYAHLIHREAERIPDICHYPMLDALSTACLLVGPDGRRFCDEKVGGIASANRIAHLDDPASTWLVLDRRIWETAGHENQIVAPNPNLPLAGARIEVADDISELARRMGIPEEPLRQTVKTARLRLSSPYMAIPVAVGLTFTMGGPLVDEHARVLGATGPIAGLYAIGGAAGGLSGGPKPAYAAGIAAAVTLGLFAAEDALSA